MPTTYTHWRFGDRCIKTLPDNLQDIINNNREIFDYLVHGPDIFFYYNCLKFNDINQFGKSLHSTSFKDILLKLKPRYKNVDDKDAALSFFLGFCCHFTLDSYCHGYIDALAETGLVSHGKIESQLDRYFMKKDELDPVKTSWTFALKPNKKMAHTFSQLFEEYDEEMSYKILKDQKFYLNLLKDTNSIKRFFLLKAMDLAHADSFKELLITDIDDERCKASNIRLDKYFEMAVKHYPILAKNMINFLEDKEDLIDYFNHDFLPKEDYKEIPLLNYEDELNYKINEFQD